jgi:plasmid stabilization system protein ParE
MQLNVPADLEALINKRLSSGAYTSPEDVLRRALEAQDAEESWTDEERHALSTHIEEGYLEAERGELVDGPLRGHARPDLTARPVRFWKLTSYPNYTIVYRPETVPLQIVAVLHGKRNIQRISTERP